MFSLCKHSGKSQNTGYRKEGKVTSLLMRKDEGFMQEVLCTRK